MEKQFTATQKYLLMSPRKVRLVVAVIKKMKPAEAVEKLPFIQKRAGEFLAKVIKNAITSAKSAGVSDTDLVFKEIQIGEGPRLKRGKAVSRGMWHPFKRRMSHIRVVLATLNKDSKTDKQIPNAKSQISKAKPNRNLVNTNEEKSLIKTEKVVAEKGGKEIKKNGTKS